jgi:hypothetical protein
MTEQVEDPKVESTEDWEKRYKDLQSTYTSETQSRKALEEELSKSKQTIEAVQPYINWDAVNGTTPEETEVDPRELDKKINKIKTDLSDEIAWSTFKAQNPELKGHETLVLSYVQKCTGTRDERLAKAKELTVRYIESLREEGKKAALNEKEETARREAEAGGLTPSATPSQDEKPVTKEEANSNYITARQAAAAKARGFV